MTGNLSASILARLLTLAKQRGDNYNLLLNRFAMERLLARVSTSAHAGSFLLKGALLFALWYDAPHRPTRDADLMDFGPDDAAHLLATFREIAAMDLGDGIVFDSESVKAQPIREDTAYGGTRLTLAARIGSARCALQIDVGFGDAVTPLPETVAYRPTPSRRPTTRYGIRFGGRIAATSRSRARCAASSRAILRSSAATSCMSFPNASKVWTRSLARRWSHG